MAEVSDSRIAGYEPLISPFHLRQALPLTPIQAEFISSSRNRFVQILQEQDPRLVMIVGPCSIHDSTAALEYASKLKALSKEVESTLFLIMRVYFEKPRTSVGWKGMLYDPHLDGSHEIQHGLSLARKLLLSLTEIQVPAATEFLDPLACGYLNDLITWGSIGARTAASQIHRQLASGLSIPIGFKNGTDGNLDLAINGLIAARAPHSHLGLNEQGQPAIIHTMGNAHTHIVLRGSECQPNYSDMHILEALNRLQKQHLPQRLMVDCSHDNCYKNHDLQTSVFRYVLKQRLEGQKGVMGLMLESNLQAGSQPIGNSLTYGVSITDPCLDWKTTEELILEAHHLLTAQRCS